MNPTPSPVVVDTTSSLFNRLKPAPTNSVKLNDAFWEPRRLINRRVTLPLQFRWLEETGRINNFRWASGKIEGSFTGRVYNDSDVYKWLEAAAWTLAGDPNPALEQLVEETIAEIAAAQQKDGYLHTFFMFDKSGERWKNLRDQHELYCAGHLIQAGIAHWRVSGSETLLNVARRFTDHIWSVFGPRGRPGTPGHPQIEMALVELFRATGEERYRDLAQIFIDSRGHGLLGSKDYHLDHQPLRSMNRLAGHAVRALYLACGASDLYAETGEPALKITLERLWENLVKRQIYISGGVGARYDGEALGADYELPNSLAYSETCAAIANVMWNWRMLQVSGDASYADYLELSLYNAVLPGISLDGRAYFYENPLADDGGRGSTVAHRRREWFDCACCPTNIIRLLAALPGYVYSVSQEGIWVHLYASNQTSLGLPGAGQVDLRLVTNYPWEGQVDLEVLSAGEFSLFLRVPGWVRAASPGELVLKINDKPLEVSLEPGSYVEIRRVWRPGDCIHLVLPMPTRYVESHPYLMGNYGRWAMMRGPLLYCLEGADHPDLDLREIYLSPGSLPEVSYNPQLLGGVVTLHPLAEIRPPDNEWDKELYRTISPALSTSEHEPCDLPGGRSHGPRVSVTAVPYFAWGNRDPGQMQVWLRRS